MKILIILCALIFFVCLVAAVCFKAGKIIGSLSTRLRGLTASAKK